MPRHKSERYTQIFDFLETTNGQASLSLPEATVDEDEGLSPDATAWDVNSLNQFQTFVRHRTSEFWEMVKTLRSDHDELRTFASWYKELQDEADALQESRDSINKKYQEAVQQNTKLVDDVLKYRQKATDLRHEMNTKVVNQEDSDHDTPKTRISKKDKSSKAPDPPIFTNGEDPTWDDWSSKMEHKLRVNYDWYPTDDSKLLRAYPDTSL